MEETAINSHVPHYRMQTSVLIMRQLWHFMDMANVFSEHRYHFIIADDASRCICPITDISKTDGNRNVLDNI